VVSRPRSPRYPNSPYISFAQADAPNAIQQQNRIPIEMTEDPGFSPDDRTDSGNLANLCLDSLVTHSPGLVLPDLCIGQQRRSPISVHLWRRSVEREQYDRLPEQSSPTSASSVSATCGKTAPSSNHANGYPSAVPASPKHLLLSRDSYLAASPVRARIE